jgi:hypothetical protein
MKALAVSRIALLCVLMMIPLAASAGQITTPTVTVHVTPHVTTHVASPTIAVGRGTKATPNDYLKYNLEGTYISGNQLSGGSGRISEEPPPPPPPPPPPK